MLVEKSAKNVTIDSIFEQKETISSLLEKIPLLSIIMALRRDLWNNHQKRFAMTQDVVRYYHRKYWPECKVNNLTLFRLCITIHGYMEEENLFRDFINNRFIISSKYFLLRRQVQNNEPVRQFDAEHSEGFLIDSLDCDEYENWEGYDDEQINSIKSFLGEVLTRNDYHLIRMVYGLNDGKPKRRVEIIKELGLNCSASTIQNRERKILGMLKEMPKFMELTEISLSEKQRT